MESEGYGKVYCYYKYVLFPNSFNLNNTFPQLGGSVGRITKIDMNDPGRVFVLFDRKEMTKRIPKDKSLPSAWMEKFHELVEVPVEKQETFLPFRGPNHGFSIGDSVLVLKNHGRRMDKKVYY